MTDIIILKPCVYCGKQPELNMEIGRHYYHCPYHMVSSGSLDINIAKINWNKYCEEFLTGKRKKLF